MSKKSQGAETAQTYEQKVAELDEILGRLDDSSTPIDELAKDVKRGAGLIKELDRKLKSVEKEVLDAFKEMENNSRNEHGPAVRPVVGSR